MGLISEPPVVLALMPPPKARLTDEQFWELCQANRDLRIERDVEGSIIITSPAGWESANRNAAITGQLWAWASQDGSGRASDSSGGFYLPNGAMRAPDAARVRRERVEALPAEERRRFPHLVPDFAIELRSESDDLAVLLAKMAEYRANGVVLGWLIDPQTRRVWVFRAGDEEPELLEDASTVSADPVLPGFVLDLRQVW